MIDARLLVEIEGFRLDVHLRSSAPITVLFGASGAGKSLTLDCLAGFAKPDQGRILIGDDIVFDSGARVDIPPRRRRCGYVFESDALFPHMTLRENLNFAAAGQSRLERTRAVEEMLDRFHLAELAGRKPRELGGGQRQRGSIARALLGQPRALLLDEPARGLDAALRRDFHDALREAKPLGAPVMLATRDLGEALELGDEMVVIEGGRILQQGAPAEVLDHPASARVARLMGCYNVAEAEITGMDPGSNASRFVCRFGGGTGSEWTGPYFPGHLLGARLLLGVRVDAVRLEAGGIPLRVRRRTPAAQGTRVEFECGLVAQTSRALAAQNSYNVSIEPGAWRVLR
jgi:molybdate transport system ATP-binding protein